MFYIEENIKIRSKNWPIAGNKYRRWRVYVIIL